MSPPLPRWRSCLLATVLGFLAAPGCDAAPPSSAAPLAKAAPKPASQPTAADRSASAGPAKPADPPAEPARKTPPAQPAPDQTKDDDVLPHPFPRHIKAPGLDGGLAWLNTSGPIELADLRGKFVILDFWTYCCINCMHVLPELKKLEQAYPNELVVIGVHSAKFDGEQDSRNIADAVERYEIEHPVVNDANHAIWDRYLVQSWPSLRVIDPEGNLVAGHGGEITFDALNDFLKDALPYYRQRKLLDTRPVRFDLEAAKARQTPLRFPGKILADEAGGRLFISDSNHNRIVVARLDGRLLEVIGSGRIGRGDGPFDQATFNHPQGLALRGQTLYVADTENHLLRKVDLEQKRVATVAGTGKQGAGWPGIEELRAALPQERKPPERWVGKPLATPLNSPWALWIHGPDLYVAMAGPHQIWKLPLSEAEIGPYAGNGREDIVDGPLLPPLPYQEGYASFAQPSGLSGDGQWLYVADSEGSSIRAVPFVPGQEVRTIVGTAWSPAARLFTFGDVDGQGREVRLQHALDVLALGGKLYVADTYNNKIKLIDPADSSCKTLVGTGQPGKADQPAQFDEPAGLSHAAGKLYVADTNNHLIRVVELAGDHRVSTLEIQGLAPPARPQPPTATGASFAGAVQVKLPEAKVSALDGKLRLQVELKLPAGFKINRQAPLRYLVEAELPTGPLDRKHLGKLQTVAEPTAQFPIDLPLTATQGRDAIKVSLAVYYCREGADGLCKMESVSWRLPVVLDPAARTKAATLPHEVK